MENPTREYLDEVRDIIEVRKLAVKANIPGAAELADEVLMAGLSLAAYRNLLKQVEVPEIRTPEIAIRYREDDYAV